MTRETALTPETHKAIVQAISLGSTYELAAQAGGVTYVTFLTWMKKGELASRKTTLTDNDKLYLAFFNDIKRVEGEAVKRWLAHIEAAANDGQWQAAAWKLERRYPKDYARTDKFNHAGKDGGDLKIIVSFEGDE